MLSTHKSNLLRIHSTTLDRLKGCTILGSVCIVGWEIVADRLADVARRVQIGQSRGVGQDGVRVRYIAGWRQKCVRTRAP